MDLLDDYPLPTTPGNQSTWNNANNNSQMSIPTNPHPTTSGNQSTWNNSQMSIPTNPHLTPPGNQSTWNNVNSNSQMSIPTNPHPTTPENQSTWNNSQMSIPTNPHPTPPGNQSTWSNVNNNSQMSIPTNPRPTPPENQSAWNNVDSNSQMSIPSNAHPYHQNVQTSIEPISNSNALVPVGTRKVTSYELHEGHRNTANSIPTGENYYSSQRSIHSNPYNTSSSQDAQVLNEPVNEGMTYNSYGDSSNTENLNNAVGPFSQNKEKKLTEMTKVLSRHAPSDASLVPVLPVHQSGYILTRISFRTLFFKRWKQCYWMHYGASQLLIFRSKEDADDWRFNPYLSKKVRSFLVRFRVDFENDRRVIPDCHGYSVGRPTRKAYGRGVENLIFQFKLERFMDFGRVIAACFGSHDEKEVISLHKLFNHLIQKTLKKKISSNFEAPVGYSRSMPARSLSQPERDLLIRDDYVFDYDSGKSIPASEFQKPKYERETQDQNTNARGRYSQEDLHN